MALARMIGPGLVLAGLLLTGCGVGSPSVEAPPVQGFDPAALIDVLPPDSIPAIRDPAHESVEEASGWLTAGDPVIVVEVAGDVRLYPVAILTRHEIVNDVIGGQAVAVTYCPLCNAAIAYERTVRSLDLTFVVSGKLYHSDLVMMDRQTKSLWPQMLGTAVLGEMEGERLDPVPSNLVSFEEAASTFPDALVLARPPDGAYGTNPYEGYDSREGPYGDFFTGEPDDRLPAMERVVGLAVAEGARAYPLSSLTAAGRPAVLHDVLAGHRIVIFAGGEQRSALDATVIADGRVVGSAGIFDPELGDRELSFEVRDGRIVDAQTGSTWTLLGVAVDGPLRGERLRARAHVDALWFAWAAFVPHTEVWRGDGTGGAR